MRFGPIARGAVTAALVLVGSLAAWGGIGAASAGAASPSGVSCGGGNSVTPGTYSALTVNTGLCYISGAVTVNGPVKVSNSSVLIVLPGGSLIVNGGVSISDNSSFEYNGVGALTVNGPFSLTNNGFFAGPAQINGSVSAVNADGLVLYGVSSVTGSIRVENTTEFTEVSLSGTTVGGSVTIQGAPSVQIYSSSIAGSLVVTGITDGGAVIQNDTLGALTFSSNSTPGGTGIGDDTINGPATCSNNAPAPNTQSYVLGPSIVRGPTHGNQAATCTGVPGGS